MDSTHDAEFEIRKRAIKDFLHGDQTQKDIYKSFNRSRRWFEYWLKQYQAHGIKGLHTKKQGYPQGKSRKYPSPLIKEIVAIRKRLEEDPEEYYYGAERIAQELHTLGYTTEGIPSLAYIKKVLSQQGCVKETKLKSHAPLRGYPENFLASLGLLCQMDFIGYKRIHNSNNPIHFLAVAYRELKYGYIWRIMAEKSSIIMPLLFEYWQENPKPDVVQMDNDWAFAGSGSALGTISHMCRFLLAVNTTPLFIPESSPWRNGAVEGLASLFSRKFWQKHDFRSLTHIDKELTIYNRKTKDYTLKRFNINLRRYNTILNAHTFSKGLINRYTFKDTDVIYFIRLGRLYHAYSAVKVLNYKIAIPEAFLNHYLLIKLHIASGTVTLYQEASNKQFVEIKKSKIKLKV